LHCVLCHCAMMRGVVCVWHAFYYHVLIVQMSHTVIFPYMPLMYFDQIHSLYFLVFNLSYHLLKTILNGCVIIVFSFTHMKYFGHICPPITLSFHPPASPKQTTCYIHVIIFFRFRFFTWEKTCDICLSQSDLFHLTQWSLTPFVYL
jgi:hypothetical protein